MTLKQALNELADLHPNFMDTIVKDNANYPIPIWSAIDQIDPGDETPIDYAVNCDGIFVINPNGYVEQIPIFQVV
jgi:hypothetical protein